MAGTHDDAADRLVAAARGDGDLDQAIKAADPNARAVASKQLVDDPAAREALHAALQRLGIEQ